MTMILSDDDIADYLHTPVEHLFWASELLDPNCKKPDLNTLRCSHLILNEAINELIQLIKKLRVNGNVYKTRHDYERLLQREREYIEDEKYFQSLKEKRETMAAEPSTEKSGNTNHAKT